MCILNSASNRPDGYPSSDFTPAKDFNQCVTPYFFIGLFIKCAPFRTNSDWDKQRVKIFKEGVRGGFGNCNNFVPNEMQKIKPFLNFNLYKE